MRSIAQRQPLCVRIERLTELMQIGQRTAQRQVRMFAIQQQTENGLRGTSIIDHLLGEKDIVQSAVVNNRTGRFVILHPLEQKDEAMDRSGQDAKKKKV